MFESYFLDFENDKILKKMSDFRLASVKAVQKHLESVPFAGVVQDACVYKHPLEIQPDYVISR